MRATANEEARELLPEKSSRLTALLDENMKLPISFVIHKGFRVVARWRRNALVIHSNMKETYYYCHLVCCEVIKLSIYGTTRKIRST